MQEPDQSNRVVKSVGFVVGLDGWLSQCLRVSSAAWMAYSSGQRVQPFVALDNLAPSDQVRHNCSKTRLICLGSFSHNPLLLAAVGHLGKRY